MRQLAIIDLNFYEDKSFSNRDVKGSGIGISVWSPTGSFSASADWSQSSGYSTGYNINRADRTISYYVGFGYDYAVAGAVAGSTSDGSYTSTTFVGATTL
ncbi:MAG: hypothetical protein ACOC07_15795 [Coleofasciculus sp.]